MDVLYFRERVVHGLRIQEGYLVVFRAVEFAAR